VTPGARIEHTLPGRTRFRVPSRRRDSAYFEQVATILAGLDGVDGVSASAVTGSVLVYHRAPLDVVITFARERELFEASAHEPPPERPQAQPLPALLGERLDQLDLAVRFSSGGRSSLNAITLGGLLLAATYQLVNGRTLPAGVTLLRYAARLVDRSSWRRDGEEVGAGS
jgi:hypothetical protein